MSLSKLRKSSSTERLTANLKAQNKKFETDPRLWYPKTDKAGNGFAVIRFLPEPECDGDLGMPYQQYHKHNFEGPNGWYIENCPTTIGLDCPCCKFNSDLWKTEEKAKRDIASAQKRRLQYISNVLVLKDPATPENEGKVFLFNYGVRIFEKIQLKLEPKVSQFEEVKPWNVCDAFEGGNFILRIRKEDNQTTYSASEFEGKSRLGDDEYIEKIWKSEYSLLEFRAPERFKPYAELETRFNKAIGIDGAPAPTSAATMAQKLAATKGVSGVDTPALPEAPTETEEVAPWEENGEESSPAVDYFKKMARGE